MEKVSIFMHTKDRFTGEKILKTPLKLIGAKTKVRDKLYQYFPRHDVYLEPFLGSGSVLIGKPKVETEVVGDLNAHAINFFQMMQEHPESLYDEIQLQLQDFSWEPDKEVDKKIFLSIRDTLIPQPLLGDRIKQAASFYVVTKACFNGIYRTDEKGKCNSSFCGTTKGRGWITPEWYDAVFKRIEGVKFAEMDATDFILNYARSYLNPGREVFMFCDPPYRLCQTTYNGLAFSDFDHFCLANNLKVFGEKEMKFMVTLNDDEYVRELYKDYTILAHSVVYSCSQTPNGRGAKSELIIMNY